MALQNQPVSQQGCILILTILVKPRKQFFLVDMEHMDASNFEIPSRWNRPSLKDILENEEIPKVFYNVSTASQTLYAHYKVSLRGVQDIQVMEELFCMSYLGNNHDYTLAGCLKEEGILFGTTPKKGNKTRENIDPVTSKTESSQSDGSQSEDSRSTDSTSNQTTLSLLHQYCVDEVQYLPALWNRYTRLLGTTAHHDRAYDETKDRIEKTQRSRPRR